MTRGDYLKGYSLFGFDLSLALCNGPHQEPTKEGDLRVTLEFGKGWPNTNTVVLFDEFDNVIKVYKIRSVLKDY